MLSESWRPTFRTTAVKELLDRQLFCVNANCTVYIERTIGGFRNKGLEEIHLTGRTRRIGAEYIRKCVRILQLLDVAAKPEEMNIAGFRFHGLQGTPKRWSVRVTGNYRITFGWSGENARDVDFEDYH